MVSRVVTSLVERRAPPGAHQVMAAGVAGPQETERKQESRGRGGGESQPVLPTTWIKKHPERVQKCAGEAFYGREDDNIPLSFYGRSRTFFSPGC